MNEYMKLHIPDYSHETHADTHLFNLDVDRYRLKRIFEYNSPSIIIQSAFRGYRARRHYHFYYKSRKKSIVVIQKYWRGSLLRKRLRADLREVLRASN